MSLLSCMQSNDSFSVFLYTFSHKHNSCVPSQGPRPPNAWFVDWLHHTGATKAVLVRRLLQMRPTCHPLWRIQSFVTQHILKVFSHHCVVSTSKTVSLLEDSPGKPAFSKATATAVIQRGNDREVLWWKTWHWNSSTHKAQVPIDFYIFGLFNCYLAVILSHLKNFFWFLVWH